MTIELIKETTTRTVNKIQSPSGHEIRIVEEEKTQRLASHWGKETSEFTRVYYQWTAPTHWSEIGSIRLDGDDALGERVNPSMASGGVSKDASATDAYAAKGWVASRMAAILATAETAIQEPGA